MKKINFNLNKRKFKYGSLATGITVIFIAVVVLVNLVFSLASDRFNWKIDLTSNSTFAVSEETVNYLKNLDSKVEITVLSDEMNLANSGTEGRQVTEIINKYAQYGENITVKYIDADKNPELVAQFNNLYKGDISNKMVVIQAGDRIRALTSGDLISYSQNQNTGAMQTSSTAEQALTTAVMAVTDANPKKVTVLTGSNSSSNISTFTELLSSNGYEVEEVDELVGEIDPESSMVIVNSPMVDYTEDQIQRLDQYLTNGGSLDRNLLYIASISQKETPNLDTFLAEYGLAVENGYAQDSSPSNMASLGGGLYGLYARISTTDNPYAEGLENASLPIMVPYARPITRLFEAQGDRETKSLLDTSSTTYVVPLNLTEEELSTLDVNNLPQGAVSVAAVGTKKNYEGTTLHTSNIIAIGSTMMLNQMFLQSTSLNNGDYLLNCMNQINGKEDTGISILPKDLTAKTFEITRSQATVIRNVVAIFIPLAILAVGIAVYIKRRHR